MYGNAQNLAALEEKTGPVLAMYRSLKSLLRPYVDAMETMETFQTPDKLKDLMEQLRVCVADVEMEEIMKLTDTMVNLLQ